MEVTDGNIKCLVELLAEFSRLLGHSFNIVNRWENGAKKFLFDDLLLIFPFLDIVATDFLFKLVGINFGETITGSIFAQKYFEISSNITSAA